MRVGLTGGIGSGKSEVARLFAARGAAIIDSDVIAREVVAPGSALLRQVVERFGRELLNADGSLDRRALRARVFADASARAELERMLHPAIRARSEQLAAASTAPYQIDVVPLLTETHAAGRYQRMLVVDCPEALQLQRLMTRDALTAEQARAMLAAQATRAERLAIADDVILNDGALEALVPQVEHLHRQYLGVYERGRGQAQ
jgi:dephospho-CoA kinase